MSPFNKNPKSLHSLSANTEAKMKHQIAVGHWGHSLIKYFYSMTVPPSSTSIPIPTASVGVVFAGPSSEPDQGTDPG